VARSRGPSWMDEGLWQYEERLVRAYYPEAFRIDLGSSSGWRVVMDPVPSPVELREVLLDLAEDAEVAVGIRGSVRSRVPRGPRDLGRSTGLPAVPRRPYLVEFEYPESRCGPAGPVHPKARVVAPAISLCSYPKHPHMNFDAAGDSWACPLSPHTSTWDWTRGATWSYLAQVALWIIKTEVWARTGGGIGTLGLWLGEATSHEAGHVVGTVGPCRCGSGLYFNNCHKQSDLDRLVQG